MRKKLVAAVWIFAITTFATSPTMGIEKFSRLDKSLDTLNRCDGNTEYWALIIGVNHRRPLNFANLHPFEKDAEEMYKTLLVSEHWKRDHIKLLTYHNATKFNILRGFYWLDRMDDGDDICLIYFAGHGGYLHLKSKRYGVETPIDLPPLDESDGCDEYITTYWSGLNPLTIITDDLFNRLLTKLDVQGVAVILGSCYSGGMNDTQGGVTGRLKHIKSKLSEWMGRFSEDISKKGRVVLMSSRENETAVFYDRTFVDFVREGLQGYADRNDDGMVSAEEAFQWAVPQYFNQFPRYNPVNCQPIMEDNYDGELVLTMVELPPSTPNISCSQELIGLPNTVFVFKAVSKDPENDSIRYGWNWRNDSIVCDRQEGNVEEWSRYYSSGEVCIMSHSWAQPGVYTVRVKAQDEHGAEIIPNYIWYKNLWTKRLWTKPLYVLIHSENETVDQYQLGHSVSYYIDKENDLAQSFIPTSNKISKIKIKLTPGCNNDDYLEQKQRFPINLSIRNILEGEDLVKASKKPYTELIMPSGNILHRFWPLD